MEHVLSVLESKGTDYWWNGPVDEFVPPHLRKHGVSTSSEWRKGADTMDVWFDSGTSWSMLTDLRGCNEVLADVCVEGSDQHRGWFQSQLLTFVSSIDQASEQARAPYRTLVTHGMVLDESGKKMSKSLGNIISPETIIRGGKVSLIASWEGEVWWIDKVYATRISRRNPPTAPTFSGCGPPPPTSERIALWARPPWDRRQRFFGRFEILLDSFLETSEPPRVGNVSNLSRGNCWVR